MSQGYEPPVPGESRQEANARRDRNYQRQLSRDRAVRGTMYQRGQYESRPVQFSDQQLARFTRQAKAQARLAEERRQYAFEKAMEADKARKEAQKATGETGYMVFTDTGKYKEMVDGSLVPVQQIYPRSAIAGPTPKKSYAPRPPPDIYRYKYLMHFNKYDAMSGSQIHDLRRSRGKRIEESPPRTSAYASRAGIRKLDARRRLAITKAKRLSIKAEPKTKWTVVPVDKSYGSTGYYKAPYASKTAISNRRKTAEMILSYNRMVDSKPYSDPARIARRKEIAKQRLAFHTNRRLQTLLHPVCPCGKSGCLCSTPK